MRDILQQNKPVLIALVVAIVVGFSSLMVVPETMQAVIVRTGEPVRVINRFRPNADFGQTGAGLVARIPFLEQVVWIDKRVSTNGGSRSMPMPASGSSIRSGWSRLRGPPSGFPNSSSRSSTRCSARNWASAALPRC